MKRYQLFGAALVLWAITMSFARADETAMKPAPLTALLGTPRPAAVDPPSAEELENAIRRGVDFLLASQNKNGSWGSPTRTKDLNIYTPVPGGHHAYRDAVTALAVAGLIESKDGRPETARAIERGGQFLIDHLPRLRRSSGDVLYNVWAHAYGIVALVRLHDRLPASDPRREEYRKVIQTQIELLSRYEVLSGGWGYYDFSAKTQRSSGSSTSFTTSTILLALDEARGIGIELPEKMVQRALVSVKRQQKPDFSYLYGEYMWSRPQHGVNMPGGSLGRSQVCNLAMRRFGDKEISNEVLSAWLDRLFARNGWLDMGRKRPVPHESYFAVAGYFFYYGHYYGAKCIEALPKEERPFYQAHMSKTLLALQEEDGSWWDYPLYNYHQPYGTGYVLMALARCRP